MCRGLSPAEGTGAHALWSRIARGREELSRDGHCPGIDTVPGWTGTSVSECCSSGHGNKVLLGSVTAHTPQPEEVVLFPGFPSRHGFRSANSAADLRSL